MKSTNKEIMQKIGIVAIAGVGLIILGFGGKIILGERKAQNQEEKKVASKPISEDKKLFFSRMAIAQNNMNQMVKIGKISRAGACSLDGDITSEVQIADCTGFIGEKIVNLQCPLEQRSMCWKEGEEEIKTPKLRVNNI